MDDWDRNDWQGRSRTQIESSYKGCALAFIAVIIAFIINIIIVLL